MNSGRAYSRLKGKAASAECSGRGDLCANKIETTLVCPIYAARRSGVKEQLAASTHALACGDHMGRGSLQGSRLTLSQLKEVGILTSRSTPMMSIFPFRAA